MRTEATILHLDLDAFFASVEQRDKPSLRGRPVVVGGVGARGVVATASYEARVFGVRSAMPSHEAKRRCPHAAFLAGRFPAYRAASRQVLEVLRDISPRVEPLSLDEAYVDLAASSEPLSAAPEALTALVAELKDRVSAATSGLTASVGVGTSKFIAKVASELDKPNGCCVVAPGAELDLLRPLPVAVIPGVGPVTLDRLGRIGIKTVGDLQRAAVDELAQVVSRTHAHTLRELAYGRDDRAVEPEREARSISAEDTFETDIVDPRQLLPILDRHAASVAGRLRAGQLFARTVTIKVRQHDFVTQTRSRTLTAATDRTDVISRVARTLLASVDTSNGVRLLGVGVAGLTDVLQEDLFGFDQDPILPDEGVAVVDPEESRPAQERGWLPGLDVVHDVHGPGWVWGTGLGRVTVRFETRETPSGPVRTFAVDDPGLHPRPLADWADGSSAQPAMVDKTAKRCDEGRELR
ncbi:MAG TPA: DNA polymerase IV [Propionibacteriaceae bacterium]|nr:DNA polymerase IV [Propionibacteriaceae bacterium]